MIEGPYKTHQCQAMNANHMLFQMLHYHVKHNQKGWVHVLPHIHFQIMNTLNVSTIFSGFQLYLNHSFYVIPTLIATDMLPNLSDSATTARTTVQFHHHMTF